MCHVPRTFRQKDPSPSRNPALQRVIAAKPVPNLTEFDGGQKIILTLGESLGYVYGTVALRIHL